MAAQPVPKRRGPDARRAPPDALPPTYPVAFALAASITQASVRGAAGHAFGWAENMVQAALKSMQLGQSAGQRILARLAAAILLAADHAASLMDSERQAFSPMLAILSAQHEVQYSRLFAPSASRTSASSYYLVANDAITQHHDHRTAPHPHRTKTCPLRVGIGGPVGSGKTRCWKCCARPCAMTTTSSPSPTTSTPRKTSACSPSAARCPPSASWAWKPAAAPTAIREDCSINLEAIDRMLGEFPNADIVFVESGGDNLAATFSPELSDLTIYVIDVAAGEKSPQRAAPASPKRPVRHQQTDLAPTWAPTWM